MEYYILLSEMSPNKLSEAVDEFIGVGWKVHGSPFCVTCPEGVYFQQAVIKEPPCDQ